MKEKRRLSEREWEEMLVERHGLENHRKVKAAHVAIAGLGGLGSHVAVMLTRVGVGHLHLVDFDRVEASNLNRQIYKIKDLGRYKTEALAEELREINPYLDLKTDTIQVTLETVGSLFAGVPILCEAFDRAEAKAMLVGAALEQLPGTIIVSGSGMAGFDSGNRIVTQQKMKRLYLCGDEISDIEQGMGLMAPRVTLCAAHQANMILRLILGYDEP